MPTHEESHEQFKRTELHERKRREIIGLVRSSDEVRDLIESGDIEKRVQNPNSSQEIFWFIHRIHAGKNFFRAINVDHQGSHINENVDTLTMQFAHRNIEEQIGELRKTESSVDGFFNVPAERLAPLARKFFAAIDQYIQQPDLDQVPDEEKLQFLARIEIIQTLCHFPVDLSGRTIEDFMVYLAKKMGIDLTFSQSGFRGSLQGNLIEHADNFRAHLRSTVMHEVTATAVEKFTGISDDTRGEFVHSLYAGTLDGVQNTHDFVEELTNFVIDKGNIPASERLDVMNVVYKLLSEELANLTKDLISEINNPVETSMWGIFEEHIDSFTDILENATQTEYKAYPYYGFVYVMKSISMSQGYIRSREPELALAEIQKAEKLLSKIRTKMQTPSFRTVDMAKSVWFADNIEKQIRKIKHPLTRLLRGT